MSSPLAPPISTYLKREKKSHTHTKHVCPVLVTNYIAIIKFLRRFFFLSLFASHPTEVRARKESQPKTDQTTRTFDGHGLGERGEKAEICTKLRFFLALLFVSRLNSSWSVLWPVQTVKIGEKVMICQSLLRNLWIFPHLQTVKFAHQSWKKGRCLISSLNFLILSILWQNFE